MGFSREIKLYQNPNFKKSHVELLYNSLIKGDFLPFDPNGYVHFRLNNGEIQSFPADDIGINLQNNAIKIAEETNVPISVQFTHKVNNRNATLIQENNIYKFHLEIKTADNQNEMFHQFNSSIKNCTPNEFHQNRIEWISNYNEEVIRCETDMYHEGVLTLCSSNRLHEFYKENKFNYEYPHGLYELFKEKIVIAVDSKDYEYTSIVETEKISNLKSGYHNSINFTDEDELLILHHGDFTMICDNHKGDYKSYGWKHVIRIPIEKKKDQVILVAKPEDLMDKKVIFQFVNIERRQDKNYWIEYEGIPTHNNRGC